MRVSPILISNRGVLPLNKTSNVKKCYLQDEPPKPETIQSPSFKGVFTKFLTTLGAVSGFAMGGGIGAVVGGVAGNGAGKKVDGWFNQPTVGNDLPDSHDSYDDWMHLSDVAY